MSLPSCEALTRSLAGRTRTHRQYDSDTAVTHSQPVTTTTCFNITFASDKAHCLQAKKKVLAARPTVTARKTVLRQEFRLEHVVSRAAGHQGHLLGQLRLGRVITACLVSARHKSNLRYSDLSRAKGGRKYIVRNLCSIPNTESLDVKEFALRYSKFLRHFSPKTHENSPD